MKLLKPLILFLVGALTYTGVEFVFRSLTGSLPVHWTMGVLGGLMFLLIGSLNELLPWDMPLLLQGLIGSAAVTAAELAAGIYLNVDLGLNIWDYSHLPCNYLGQISLLFSLFWVALAIVAVLLDDGLRYLLFGEKYPRYTLLRWGAEAGGNTINPRPLRPSETPAAAPNKHGPER